MTHINHLHLFVALVILLMISCTDQKKDETKTHIVEIKQMSFVPENLTVSPGDSVKWINKDFVSHDVQSDNSGTWKSSNLAEGESFTVKITSETSYKCTLHPVMQGEIQLDSES